MNRIILLFVAVFLMYSFRAHGGEIGFNEQFSLAEDRSIPLKQLIPGTEEYYYYHCLFYEQTGQTERFQGTLNDWIKRYGYTQQVEEIRNRQALLNYSADPQGSLKFIRDRLNLLFNHEKRQLTPKTNYPVALNKNLIGYDTLKNRAYSMYNNLQDFEDAGLEPLSGETGSMSGDRLRDFLRRIKRPDYPQLARLVIQDLQYENSGGFGSHPIHRLLLLSQLDACLQLMPDLLLDSNFVNIYLAKLQPNPDVDWRGDNKEKRAFLDRIWTFVKRLPPSQNSLRAHVLFQILLLERSQGTYDKPRFMEYIKLPRQVSYINQKYLNRREFLDSYANLGANYQPYTLFPSIGDDEQLVRDFLKHFFIEDKDYKEYATFIDSEYLKPIFAETKIVNGIGNQEQWFSLAGPEALKALKDRIDLEFVPQNREQFTLKDTVALDIALKNVPTLIIKTFQVNTLNFYKEKGEEITTAVDLDGLIANEEKVVQYQEPEIRRHVEHFEFPTLTRPGLYVIEFIGNGQSSRALVRKGRMNFTERRGSAGHVFTVYDEDNNRIASAQLWLSGHQYDADPTGEIAVPYSNSPGTQKFILMADGFATLHQFNHLSEGYALEAGIFVDRESLLEGQTSKILIRPDLTLNGVPIDPGLVEETALTINTTDQDGIQASKEIKDFKLSRTAESVFEFKVPEKLSRIQVTLRGKIQVLSQNKKNDLAASRSFEVNGISKTDKIEDLHLRWTAGKYLLELLGKNGEPRPDRAVNLTLRHRFFRRTIDVTLQTDAQGKIDLTDLPNIASVVAKGTEGTTRTWNLPDDRRSLPGVIHGIVGKPLVIPVMENLADTELQQMVSLLEVRGDTYVADHRQKLSYKDGNLRIDDLPAGDYELWLRKSDTTIKIRLTAGKIDGSFALSKTRFLQVRKQPGVQISRLTSNPDKAEIMVQLTNVTQSSRVHVVATRFVPNLRFFETLGNPSLGDLSQTRILPCFSQYISGRNIGDEYRYILERKYAQIFPGNMLKMPSLLLNPWSLRKTDTGKSEAAAGEGWAGSPAPQMSEPSSEAPAPVETGGMGEGGDFSDLDFLPEISFLAFNLKPDQNGVVAIDAKTCGGRQHVQVIALDGDGIACRELPLPFTPEEYKDLRLIKALDPAKHFSEQKNISVINASGEFLLEDITTSKFEAFDSLANVYTLYQTLNNDPNLTEFGFILTWPDLPIEKKRELYSKYACHELSFFLFKKDPEFFKTAIKPYLANKKDKTFLDHWLLEDDLGEYLTPWKFNRLNIVEQILLGRRIKDQSAAMGRHVKDVNDLIPPDIEKFNHLFNTALKGSALETGDKFGFARETKKMAMLPPAAPPPPPAPGLAGAMSFRGGANMPKKAKMEKGRPSAKTIAGKDAAREEQAMDSKADMESLEMAAPEPSPEESDSFDDNIVRDERRRASGAKQFYRALDKTEEWVENNYYHLPIERQIADLVTVNGFWTDFAADSSSDKPFFSVHLAEPTRNFTEMMFALAVLDLPFKAANHVTDYRDARMSLRPGNGLVIFHKEIKETQPEGKAHEILTSQNFFVAADRYRYDGKERFDKFVTEEFQTGKVYGCQVVITNPTSTRKKIDALLQIPKGALPVRNGFYTKSIHCQLEPFSTQTAEYFFYFPAPGSYPHYPVHVAQNEKVIGFTDPFTFNVVLELTKFDKTSWDYISQHATDEDVIRFLSENNIDRYNLDDIAFRMKNPEYFRLIISLLQGRHVYSPTLWSYGVLHNDPAAAREFLLHSSLAGQVGMYLDCPLLPVDPIARFDYQHREYWPLVNARIYQLGKKRQILNAQFFGQYNQFLTYLQYKPKMGDMDCMVITCYLLLQDRVREAIGFFGKIGDPRITETIQYQYLKAFLAFCLEKPEEAGTIAKKYEAYPVDRWRNLFADISAQVGEMSGNSAKIIDKEDRNQVQTKLAAQEPSFDLKVENKTITLQYQNLSRCTINYYLMDIELLFSRNPFVQEVSGKFSIIHPNDIATLELPNASGTFSLPLPDRYFDKNVMVEIIGAGVSKAQAYYSHSMGIQVMENYGQLKISHQESGKPLPKAYVKVFAKMKSGGVQFYKDGYTDLRGRFDYTSLSTSELENVERFSILIMSERNGAVVREAAPPKM